jgi:hypothetical protein
MGPDKKVRKRRAAGSAAPTVGELRLALEEGRLIGNWLPLEQIARQRRVELLDSREPD